MTDIWRPRAPAPWYYCANAALGVLALSGNLRPNRGDLFRREVWCLSHSLRRLPALMERKLLGMLLVGVFVFVF